MYFPYWIILVAISLWVSLAAFIWGLWSGQFADQDRARFLALSRETFSARASASASADVQADDPSKSTVEIYVLLFFGLIFLLGLSAAVFVSLRTL